MEPEKSAAAPKVEYIDVPAVREVFADSVRETMFDGQHFRLELAVTRIEAADGGAAGKRYTAARLVLPPSAALELSQRLGRVFSAMLKHDADRKKAGTPAA